MTKWPKDPVYEILCKLLTLVFHCMFFPELGTTSNTKVTLYFPLMVYNVITVEQICLKFDMQNNPFGKIFGGGKKKIRQVNWSSSRVNMEKKVSLCLKIRKTKQQCRIYFRMLYHLFYFIWGRGRGVKISCTRLMLLVDISNILPQLKIYRSIGSSWKIKVLPKVQFPYFQ